jgi:hypothetical protein
MNFFGLSFVVVVCPAAAIVHPAICGGSVKEKKKKKSHPAKTDITSGIETDCVGYSSRLADP